MSPKRSVRIPNSECNERANAERAQMDSWRRSVTEQKRRQDAEHDDHAHMREELHRLLEQTARMQDQLAEMRHAIERLVDR